MRPINVNMSKASPPSVPPIMRPKGTWSFDEYPGGVIVQVGIIVQDTVMSKLFVGEREGGDGVDGEEDDEGDEDFDDVDEPFAHPFGLYGNGGCEMTE